MTTVCCFVLVPCLGLPGLLMVVRSGRLLAGALACWGAAFAAGGGFCWARVFEGGEVSFLSSWSVQEKS